MKYCKSCKLKIENDLTKCPLCGSFTDSIGSDFNSDYPVVRNSYLLELTNRCMLFFTIAISVVSLFVNRYLAPTVPWSIMTIISIIYLNLSLRSIIKKKQNYGFFILMQVVMISIVGWVIDLLTGYKGWSVDYVIPFVIISGSATISILSTINSYKYKDYLIYLFISAILGFVPIILIANNWTHVYWTSASCVIYSVLTVLAMVIFTRRRLNAELKRRLHF